MIAALQHPGRNDVALKAVVSRLSLEPSVNSVTWNLAEPAVPLVAAGEWAAGGREVCLQRRDEG